MYPEEIQEKLRAALAEATTAKQEVLFDMLDDWLYTLVIFPEGSGLEALQKAINKKNSDDKGTIAGTRT